ncbi:galactose mutarotase [Bradyrhizobium diazoefficiens]|nr:aldose epimerase family protein [Bradyrhizobium diazoefficiens]MBR0773354.1 galactose mutarotase [Bradyrhizobium diazoefficiens]
MAVSKIQKEIFGTLPDGRNVERIVLRGEGGFEARVITHGAVLQALIAPDANGGYDDVVLGHDAFGGYLAERKFLGATVGRYANRIAKGRFSLDGRTVQLPVNNGPNALHGGLDGFDRKLWEIAGIDDGAEPAVTLTYTSPDGEENYPGRLDVRLTYRVTGPTELSLTMEARTDRPTIVNLTNHSFFNLEGATSGTPILDHKLMVAAEHFLAIDPTAIPLPGPPRAVAGTPFDFRDARPVGERIRQSDQQLQNGRGYDHTYCLGRDGRLALAARLEAPRSGRVMELFTNQPGLQVYSGNFLDGTISGKGGKLIRQSDALCLEPHIWPDAPNRPDFPSPRLAPGEVYRHHTVYRFGVKTP